MQEKKEASVMPTQQDWDDFIAEVAETVGAEDSAIVAINGLIERILATNPGPDVRAVITQFQSKRAEVAAAIAAIPPVPPA